MLAGYGLKALEYLFYAAAAVVAFELYQVQSEGPDVASRLAGVIFILIGLGVLVPRMIAYRQWPRVTARVGEHRATWDGEQSAGYSYAFDDRQFHGKLRSVYGSARPTRIEVCVNPRAPRVRYLVLWNLWLAGLAFLVIGGSLLTTGSFFFGLWQ
jgi:hypothetical protein